MATSATGTPSTNFTFPKINTAVDAPDGKGINSIVDDIDTKLAASTTNLGAVGRINVSKAGALIGTRRGVNLIEGSGVTLTVADNAGAERVDVTIAASGGSTVSVYDRVTADSDVQNTAADTALYTKTLTGGDISTNKKFRLEAFGDMLYNNNTVNTIQLKVKLGGTTILDTGAAIPDDALSATRSGWILRVSCQARGAANAQLVSFELRFSDNGGAVFTTGTGAKTIEAAGGAETVEWLGHALGTVDLSSNQDLVVSVTWSAASANNSFRLRAATLELI